MKLANQAYIGEICQVSEHFFLAVTREQWQQNNPKIEHQKSSNIIYHWTFPYMVWNTLPALVETIDHVWSCSIGPTSNHSVPPPLPDELKHIVFVSFPRAFGTLFCCIGIGSRVGLRKLGGVAEFLMEFMTAFEGVKEIPILGTNISPCKGILKMIFLCPR